MYLLNGLCLGTCWLTPNNNANGNVNTNDEVKLNAEERRLKIQGRWINEA